MTSVSIRCTECDDVKPEEQIDFVAGGAVCDDCRTGGRMSKLRELRAKRDDDTEDPETDAEGGTNQADDAEPQDESEGDERQLNPGDFTGNDALSW